MKTIQEILIKRDGINQVEADLLVWKARKKLLYLLKNNHQILAKTICFDHFKLEPDYLDQLMNF